MKIVFQSHFAKSSLEVRFEGWFMLKAGSNPTRHLFRVVSRENDYCVPLSAKRQQKKESVPPTEEPLKGHEVFLADVNEIVTDSPTVYLPSYPHEKHPLHMKNKQLTTLLMSAEKEVVQM